MIYWFTGQPSAGKTTLAKGLIISKSIHIDGDDLRDIFENKDYSQEGRRKNVELAQNIAFFLNKKGYNPIVSLVSPYRDQREKFKSRMGNQIIELFVHSDQDRGRKNYYVTDYEPPLDEYININTDLCTEEEMIEELNQLLRDTEKKTHS